MKIQVSKKKRQSVDCSFCTSIGISPMPNQRAVFILADDNEMITNLCEKHLLELLSALQNTEIK